MLINLRESANMMLLRFLLFYMLLHIIGSTATEDTQNDDAKLTRILRDITGRYHPELHGEHAEHRHSHAHAHTHEHDHGPGTVNALHIQSTSGTFDLGGPDQGSSRDGYVSSPPPSSPNGYANCGCVPKNQCAPQVLALQGWLLQALKNDVVCGTQFDLCCYDDPWPGPVDTYKPIAPCVPTEYCVRPYGSDPYDIQNYGVIGPCVGLGSVRCLDNKPVGPTTIVIPIYEPPPPSPPVYVPPPTQPPPTLPPVIYEPPPTEAPTTLPPVIYEPPPTVAPPTLPPVYEPPPTVYEPPVETYVPPVETYVPPTPVETYVPPTPVETYVPPAPVETYVPPTPVETYVPPTPVETYEPPSETYEPPTPVDDEPPATSYGVPGNGIASVVAAPRRSSYFGGGYPHYAGYRSRFGGYPYGLGGFRKRFRFSKGFYG